MVRVSWNSPSRPRGCEASADGGDACHMSCEEWRDTESQTTAHQPKCELRTRSAPLRTRRGARARGATPAPPARPSPSWPPSPAAAAWAAARGPAAWRGRAAARACLGRRDSKGASALASETRSRPPNAPGASRTWPAGSGGGGGGGPSGCGGSGCCAPGQCEKNGLPPPPPPPYAGGAAGCGGGAAAAEAACWRCSRRAAHFLSPAWAWQWSPSSLPAAIAQRQPGTRVPAAG